MLRYDKGEVMICHFKLKFLIFRAHCFRREGVLNSHFQRYVICERPIENEILMEFPRSKGSSF